jgi:hypothetical protein
MPRHVEFPTDYEWSGRKHRGFKTDDIQAYDGILTALAAEAVVLVTICALWLLFWHVLPQ